MARPTTAGRRYAEAVFDLAKRDDRLEPTATELRTAAALMADEQVARIVDNPAVPLKERERVIEQLLKGRASPVVLNLTRLLAQRGRIDSLGAIAAEYTKLLNRAKGIATAVVTSAEPLTDEQVDAIRARISKMAGTEIEMTTNIDPSLIGGLTVQVGDRLMDASVRGRLERLRDQLVAGAR